MNYLKEEKEAKLVVERSKFLSYCFVCESLDVQAEQIRTMKKIFPSATHVCYASIIDDGDVKMYANDDGEPSGTAGLPILSVLKENQMINTICFVVRYFGGVKLGTSGLIKAYKESANLVVDNNSCPVSKKSLFIAKCEYTNLAKIQHVLSKNQIKIEKSIYDEKITFEIYANDEEFKLIEPFLVEFEKKSHIKYCAI